MPILAVYISGHGFGHASRQIEIINALGPRLRQGNRILIRTAAAPWLFERTLRANVDVIPGEVDTGIVQIDSLRLDERATALRAAEFYATFDQRTTREAELLAAHDVCLVVADAPPLACAAAAAAGLDSVVISNFTWDWIYEAYRPQFDAVAPDVLPMIRRAYSSAREAWRLPMHGGFETIATVYDRPFVARRATHDAQAVLATLRLPVGRPLALFSFGGYGVNAFDWHALDCRDTWTVVVADREPLGRLPAGVAYVDEAELYGAGLRYEDLLAAVDVVVSKPGYGIISECAANDTALLYTSRGRFPEYDVMVREMPRVLRCRYLDQESLLAGRWRGALDGLLHSPPPATAIRTDGAGQIAADLTEWLNR